MKEPTLVSIIIPTYNRLNYFIKALNSALNQTYKNIEILITDDSTIDQIENYVKTLYDSRIKYFRNKERLGIALNTKNGITKSTGQYFAFLNDDDFWCETFLEKLVSLIENHDKVGCAFSDHWLVNGNGEVLPEESHKNSITYKRNLLTKGLVPKEKWVELFVNFTVPVAMACIIKREAIDINNYPIEIGGAYDRWLLLQLIENKEYNFVYMDEKLTNYRVHSQSVTVTQSANVSKSVLYILIRSKKVLKLSRYHNNNINMQIRAYIRNLIKNRSIASLKYFPLYFKTYIGLF